MEGTGAGTCGHTCLYINNDHDEQHDVDKHDAHDDGHDDEHDDGHDDKYNDGKQQDDEHDDHDSRKGNMTIVLMMKNVIHDGNDDDENDYDGHNDEAIMVQGQSEW